jgi:hypothetical protein
VGQKAQLNTVSELQGTHGWKPPAPCEEFPIELTALQRTA